MTVIAHVVLRGVTEEQYDAVRERTGWLRRTPFGGHAHLTWWQDGDCHNVDAWETEAALLSFSEQRLGPALAAVGVPAAPEITLHPAHEVFAPRRVTFTATPGDGDHVATVRQGYEAFARGDVAGVLALMADDVRWSTPRSVPFGVDVQGREAVGAFFASLGQHFTELSVVPSTYLADDDVVVARGRTTGRTRSGGTVDAPFAHVWTMRDGIVAAFEEHTDTAALNLALALPAPRATHVG